MAAADPQNRDRPVAIAPAPVRISSSEIGANGDVRKSTMPYTCQTCAKRKVKCDKLTPICSSCRLGRFNCLYQAPPPRRRKRSLSSGVHEKLARYERILLQHGLLPQGAETTSSVDDISLEPISLSFVEPETSRTGQILTGQGKSRYIDSKIWRTLGDDAMQRISDDEEDDQDFIDATQNSISDPLTEAFIGSQQDLLQYHPTPKEAIILWETHVENVEPLCKILHIPSSSKMIEVASNQPEMASKADQCLLFAIYHFAVFSMTEEECSEKLAQSRAALMRRYQFATRQALVNASFLKTTKMSIMQALVLFLLPCRYVYDPHTYWILTGVAIRIAQRMGLHRDGEKMGLPPFDVQMRRRLFYQIIPLDGFASQISGTGITLMPDTWDTQRPLNINDDQIWPGMTNAPEEQRGATEMMFCLARSCVGMFTRAVKPTQGGTKTYDELEETINEAEREVEEKYVRYCDIVNPLHFLTVGLVRSAITSMRIRIRLPKVKNNTATDAEKRELFQLSQKIMDTNTAACAHPGLRKYLWHAKPFFAWGSWDALVFIVTSLRSQDLLSPAENHAAWNRVEQVYKNHDVLLDSKSALHSAIGRLTLKAWDANPSNRVEPEPEFIVTLRFLHKTKSKSQAQTQDRTPISLDSKMDTLSPIGLSDRYDADTFFDGISGDMRLDTGNDSNLDTPDWAFWDQLIQDYQAQSG